MIKRFLKHLYFHNLDPLFKKFNRNLEHFSAYKTFTKKCGVVDMSPSRGVGEALT